MAGQYPQYPGVNQIPSNIGAVPLPPLNFKVQQAQHYAHPPPQFNAVTGYHMATTYTQHIGVQQNFNHQQQHSYGQYQLQQPTYYAPGQQHNPYSHIGNLQPFVRQGQVQYPVKTNKQFCLGCQQGHCKIHSGGNQNYLAVGRGDFTVKPKLSQKEKLDALIANDKDYSSKCERLYRRFAVLFQVYGPMEATNEKIINRFLHLSVSDRQFLMVHGSVEKFLTSSECFESEDGVISLKREISLNPELCLSSSFEENSENVNTEADNCLHDEATFRADVLPVHCEEESEKNVKNSGYIDPIDAPKISNKNEINSYYEDWGDGPDESCKWDLETQDVDSPFGAKFKQNAQKHGIKIQSCGLEQKDNQYCNDGKQNQPCVKEEELLRSEHIDHFKRTSNVNTYASLPDITSMDKHDRSEFRQPSHHKNVSSVCCQEPAIFKSGSTPELTDMDNARSKQQLGTSCDSSIFCLQKAKKHKHVAVPNSLKNIPSKLNSQKSLTNGTTGADVNSEDKIKTNKLTSLLLEAKDKKHLELKNSKQMAVNPGLNLNGTCKLSQVEVISHSDKLEHRTSKAPHPNYKSLGQDLNIIKNHECGPDNVENMQANLSQAFTEEHCSYMKNNADVRGKSQPNPATKSDNETQIVVEPSKEKEPKTNNSDIVHPYQVDLKKSSPSKTALKTVSGTSLPIKSERGTAESNMKKDSGHIKNESTGLEEESCGKAVDKKNQCNENNIKEYILLDEPKSLVVTMEERHVTLSQAYCLEECESMDGQLCSEDENNDLYVSTLTLPEPSDDLDSSVYHSLTSEYDEVDTSNNVSEGHKTFSSDDTFVADYVDTEMDNHDVSASVFFDEVDEDFLNARQDNLKNPLVASLYNHSLKDNASIGETNCKQSSNTKKNNDNFQEAVDTCKNIIRDTISTLLKTSSDSSPKSSFTSPPPSDRGITTLSPLAPEFKPFQANSMSRNYSYDSIPMLKSEAPKSSLKFTADVGTSTGQKEMKNVETQTGSHYNGLVKRAREAEKIAMRFQGRVLALQLREELRTCILQLAGSSDVEMTINEIKRKARQEYKKLQAQVSFHLSALDRDITLDELPDLELHPNLNGIQKKFNVDFDDGISEDTLLPEFDQEISILSRLELPRNTEKENQINGGKEPVPNPEQVPFTETEETGGRLLSPEHWNSVDEVTSDLFVCGNESANHPIQTSNPNEIASTSNTKAEKPSVMRQAFSAGLSLLKNVSSDIKATVGISPSSVDDKSKEDTSSTSVHHNIESNVQKEELQHAVSDIRPKVIPTQSETFSVKRPLEAVAAIRSPTVHTKHRTPPAAPAIAQPCLRSPSSLDASPLLPSKTQKPNLKSMDKHATEFKHAASASVTSAIDNNKIPVSTSHSRVSTSEREADSSSGEIPMISTASSLNEHPAQSPTILPLLHNPSVGANLLTSKPNSTSCHEALLTTNGTLKSIPMTSHATQLTTASGGSILSTSHATPTNVHISKSVTSPPTFPLLPSATLQDIPVTSLANSAAIHLSQSMTSPPASASAPQTATRQSALPTSFEYLQNEVKSTILNKYPFLTSQPSVLASFVAHQTSLVQYFRDMRVTSPVDLQNLDIGPSSLPLNTVSTGGAVAKNAFPGTGASILPTGASSLPAAVSSLTSNNMPGVSLALGSVDISGFKPMNCTSVRCPPVPPGLDSAFNSTLGMGDIPSLMSVTKADETLGAKMAGESSRVESSAIKESSCQLPQASETGSNSFSKQIYDRSIPQYQRHAIAATITSPNSHVSDRQSNDAKQTARINTTAPMASQYSLLQFEESSKFLSDSSEPRNQDNMENDKQNEVSNSRSRPIRPPCDETLKGVYQSRSKPKDKDYIEVYSGNRKGLLPTPVTLPTRYDYPSVMPKSKQPLLETPVNTYNSNAAGCSSSQPGFRQSSRVDWTQYTKSLLESRSIVKTPPLSEKQKSSTGFEQVSGPSTVEEEMWTIDEFPTLKYYKYDPHSLKENVATCPVETRVNYPSDNVKKIRRPSEDMLHNNDKQANCRTWNFKSPPPATQKDSSTNQKNKIADAYNPMLASKKQLAKVSSGDNVDKITELEQFNQEEEWTQVSKKKKKEPSQTVVQKAPANTKKPTQKNTSVAAWGSAQGTTAKKPAIPGLNYAEKSPVCTNSGQKLSQNTKALGVSSSRNTTSSSSNYVIPEGKKASNYLRLLQILQEKFPNSSSLEIKEGIETVRNSRGGLSGCSVQQIVQECGWALKKKSRTGLNQLEEDDDDPCVICHDSLTVGPTKKLECGHQFHDHCIKRWVYGRERTCPTCRQHTLFPEEFPQLGKS